MLFYGRLSLFIPKSHKNKGNRQLREFALETRDISSYESFLIFKKNMQDENQRRRHIESTLINNGDSFLIDGFCFVCKKKVDFITDYLYSTQEVIEGKRIPNWRERVVCPECGLNNRVRAAIHFLEFNLQCTTNSRIFISEQCTPLYGYLKRKYTNLIGSEYLGSKVPFGDTDINTGIRNESLTKLTFKDNSIDYVLSFDVFEHIPNYSQALKECYRILSPNGRLLFTVPFRMDVRKNIVRAEVDNNGQIRHVLPPEYHGDPINQEGCLCFYHFGWALLEDLKTVGFQNPRAHLYWSDEFGYFGQNQVLFSGEKHTTKY